MSLSVAQIGLGRVGVLYTEHLLEAGVALTAYDIVPERTAPLVRRGVTVATTIKETVAQVDYVLVALPDPDADRAALLGSEGAIAAAKPGTLFLDVSTIDPHTARDLYAAAKERQIDYVEAPVSGGEPMSAGTEGARKGNITFMAAGDEEAFHRAKPLMEILGKYYFYLGASGMGSTVKLISNHLSGLHNLIASEAFAIGKAIGIDPEVLFKVFEHTDANSYWLLNGFAPRIRANNYTPGFSVDLQYKDHRLMEDVAREFKVPMPFNAMALQTYQMLRARGDGGKDLVEAANFMAELAGCERYDGERLKK